MPNKQEITGNVLVDLGPDCAWSLEQALVAWWRDVRPQGGLQLSVTGYRIFLDLANYQCWRFELSPGSPNSRELIALDRKLTWPWALIRNKSSIPELVLFGSRDAVMATLYGDPNQWLSSLL